MKKLFQKLIEKRHIFWLTAFLVGTLFQKWQPTFPGFNTAIPLDVLLSVIPNFMFGFILAFNFLPLLFPISRERLQFYLRIEFALTIWLGASILGSLGPDHFHWLFICGLLTGYTCRPAMGMYWVSRKLNSKIAFFEKMPLKDKAFILKSDMLITAPIRVDQRSSKHGLLFVMVSEFDVKVFLKESKDLQADVKMLHPIFKIPLLYVMKRIELFFEEKKMLMEEDNFIYGDDIEVNSNIVQRRHLFEQDKNDFFKEWGIAYNAVT